MRILVIGSKGNMGRRYMAILKHLGIDALGVDVGDGYPDPDAYDRAIIATTTELHWLALEHLTDMGKDFLCEKPLSQDLDFIESLIFRCLENNVDGRMVCNWAFTTSDMLSPNSHKISYDCYNTGKDGLAWDCIQLIYLADGFPKLKTEAPFLQAYIDGEPIAETEIASSYVNMIEAWLQNPSLLWSLEDAKRATEKTFKYMEAHK